MFAPQYRDTTLICALLLVAAIGKSAQAGLHIWLPEAMEGPTPVSSLIHAATMVTAGIFLLARCSYIFGETNTLFTVVIFIGSVTAFAAATIGLLQSDIKKIIAYSTNSQLGYMFVCCGFSAHDNSMYHLFNHAFFKAPLFLTAGYIIHTLCDEQDIRKMGGPSKVIPYSYSVFIVGSMSLVGFPYFSGFYSKDKVLELCHNYYVLFIDGAATYRYIIFAQVFRILAVIFTLVHSMKLMFYVYISSYSGFPVLHIERAFFVHIDTVAIVFPGHSQYDQRVYNVGYDGWCRYKFLV